MYRILRSPGGFWQFLALLWLASLLLIGLRLKVDNSPEIWLPQDDSEVRYYQNFKEHFGSDSVLALASATQTAGSLPQRLESLEGIASVTSPYDEDGKPLEDSMAQRLVSHNGDQTVLLLVLEESMQPREVLSLLEEVETIAAEQGQFLLVGTETVTRALKQGSERSFGGLFPLVALALAGLVYLFFRSWRIILAILAAASSASVLTLASMALLGRSLNLLVVLIPAILVVLTVAASIHLANRARSLASKMTQEGQRDRNLLWLHAIKATWKPCLLASVTTSVGFASLGVSQLDPVRDLGIFTALGSILVLVFVFCFVPLLESRRPITLSLEKTALLGESYVVRLARARMGILGAGLGLFLFACAGVPKLVLESNIMDFFPQDHPIPNSYENFEKDFFGLTGFELVLTGPLAKITKPASIQALNSVRDQALKKGLITSSASPWIVESDNEEAETLQKLPYLLQEIPSELRSYLWRGGNTAALRVSLAAPTGSSNAAYEAVLGIREIITQTELPPGVSLRVSGQAPLLVRGQVLLLKTQVQSFALALILITTLIGLTYRSYRMTLYALICNLFPVIATLGLMGWLEVPLNAGTVTVAGIALGLIVDDTVHILHELSAIREKAENQDLTRVLKLAGRPVLITSLAVALGFGIFAVADFQPTRYFGLLTAATAGFAVVADLVLLPALLARKSQES